MKLQIFMIRKLLWWTLIILIYQSLACSVLSRSASVFLSVSKYIEKKIIRHKNNYLSDFSSSDASDEEELSGQCFLRKQFWQCIFWGSNFERVILITYFLRKQFWKCFFLREQFWEINFKNVFLKKKFWESKFGKVTLKMYFLKKQFLKKYFFKKALLKMYFWGRILKILFLTYSFERLFYEEHFWECVFWGRNFKEVFF